MSRKKVTNAEIITALLEHGTVKAAAAALNVSVKTLYNRIKTPEFEHDYNAAKDELLSSCLYKVLKSFDNALSVINELMEGGEEVKPNTRLQAAQTIINSVVKFTQRIDETEKMKYDLF